MNEWMGGENQLLRERERDFATVFQAAFNLILTLLGWIIEYSQFVDTHSSRNLENHRKLDFCADLLAEGTDQFFLILCHSCQLCS